MTARRYASRSLPAIFVDCHEAGAWAVTRQPLRHRPIAQSRTVRLNFLSNSISRTSSPLGSTSRSGAPNLQAPFVLPIYKATFRQPDDCRGASYGPTAWGMPAAPSSGICGAFPLPPSGQARAKKNCGLASKGQNARQNAPRGRISASVATAQLSTLQIRRQVQPRFNPSCC